jgi:hypothetical protein
MQVRFRQAAEVDFDESLKPASENDSSVSGNPIPGCPWPRRPLYEFLAALVTAPHRAPEAHVYRLQSIIV